MFFLDRATTFVLSCTLCERTLLLHSSDDLLSLPVDHTLSRAAFSLYFSNRRHRASLLSHYASSRAPNIAINIACVRHITLNFMFILSF